VGGGRVGAVRPVELQLFPSSVYDYVSYLDETLPTFSHVLEGGLSDGANTVVVTATDRATNEGMASFTLVRDATPPAVAVTATVQAEDIRVTWAATDLRSGLDTCRLEVDTGDGSQEELSTSCEGSRLYTEVEPGQTYTFHLTATDNVGNQASAEATSGLPRVIKYYYHGGKRVAMRSGGQVYYLHGDHLGSTSLSTRENGEIVARQLYHPYGTVRYSEGTLPTDFGFAGQRHDGTGLVFMRARYYHAGLGRFTQADTIVPEAGNPQDLNRFAYARNNPVRYIDPSGHVTGPPRADGICVPGSCNAAFGSEQSEAMDVTPTATPTPTPTPSPTREPSQSPDIIYVGLATRELGPHYVAPYWPEEHPKYGQSMLDDLFSPWPASARDSLNQSGTYEKPYDNDPRIEEPDEVKVSRPVLEWR
jgi:RHS repeat-associated protein